VRVSLWVGLCLYFSLLDRTPRSYVLMLAGYTAALVSFPAVADPGTIFDTAVARAEEITLSILCASLVGSIVLPQSVAPVIKTRLDQLFSDARAFSAAVLARSPSSNRQTERLRLACCAIGFDALATPLRYDMTGAERSADAMTTLRQHMLMFLPIVASIADRIEMLERMQALPDALRQRLDDMAAWRRNRAVIRKAFRAKYACGAISPNNVITIAEKKNAPTPARTESDSSVKNTLLPTLPQITVASTRLEFFRRSRTRAASLFPPSASICRRNWLRLKIARFRPAKSADSVMQVIIQAKSR
jgi:hypothetical protein